MNKKEKKQKKQQTRKETKEHAKKGKKGSKTNKQTKKHQFGLRLIVDQTVERLAPIKIVQIENERRQFRIEIEISVELANFRIVGRRRQNDKTLQKMRHFKEKKS
uniref:Uncharacterized protein n=1 Tax=Romanomermis culicivorax TaxID=13658 RepID=A0A915KYS1_ROMCU